MVVRKIGVFLIVLIVVLASFSYLFAEEKATGIHRISMALSYTDIKVPPGENLNLDLMFINRGKMGEHVYVWVDKAPEGWKTSIEGDYLEVSGLYVPAGTKKVLSFLVTPPSNVKPGKYNFKIVAKTRDGKYWMRESATIEVVGSKGVSTGKIQLTTFYPVIRGPVKGKFKFTIMVKSGLDREEVFNLLAKGPEGWDINFKPTLQSTYISSIRLQANQSKTLEIEVKPPLSAAAGEYPIEIKVATKEAEAKAKLKVILTGSYELKVGAAKGLLSIDARPGKPSNVSLYVRNTGTAINKDISFTSFKPENWKVQFNPPRINFLKPGEIKQVEVVITPYEGALVGDYSIEIKAKGEEGSQDSVEFRVSVKASPVWGWIGIGIILFVIGGLILVFRFFGRR